MRVKPVVSFANAVLGKWVGDKIPQLAAALAYFTVFSMAPLLVIFVAMTGMFLGREAVQEQILDQARELLGGKVALVVQALIGSITRRSSSIIATLISVGIILFGASRVFAQLRDALDTIWEVEPASDRVIIGSIMNRTYAFLVVLAAGFMLLAALIVDAAVVTATRHFEDYLPGWNIIWRIGDLLVWFGLLTFVFALVFKALPHAKVAWRDVWLGAVVTTLLFSAGRTVLGYYLGSGVMGSIYGAAGSFVVILFWFYWSAQILFLGAACAQVYASRYGSLAERTED